MTGDALLSEAVGYARVSTHEQNLGLQIDALRGANCQRIFTDEGMSGACIQRPELDRALLDLRPGDVLVTWKLDRLGRSLGHLIQLISDLEERDIGFRSLSESIDTTTAGGRLVFHVMGALAEFERALISERTKAGMEAARKRGATIGRPPKLKPEQVVYARRMIANKVLTPENLAAQFGVSPLTLSRALEKAKTTALNPAVMSFVDDPE